MRQLVIRWQLSPLPANARWDLAHYQHSKRLAKTWQELAALLPDPVVAKTAWLERQGQRGEQLRHLALRPYQQGSLMDVRLSSPLRPESWLKDVFVPWQGPTPRWATLEVHGREAKLTLLLWDLPVSKRRSPAAWAAVMMAILLIPLQGMTHIVRPGETLSQIARHQLGRADLWPALYQANHGAIGDPHWIYPGQQLTVPKLEPRRTATYRVRPGDTLSGIALAHWGRGDLWPRLYAANRNQLGDPHWIHVGQLLQLPGGGHLTKPIRRHVRPHRRPLIRRVVLKPVAPPVSPPQVVTVRVAPVVTPPVPEPQLPPVPPLPAAQSSVEGTPPPDPLFLENDPLF